jgi:hypothetical protein
VVILGAVLASWLGVFDGDEDAAGAEDAVREYLELIEDGQAEQATRMVPLARTRLDGDDEFLEDEVLDAADERIVVGDVRTKWSHENRATVSAEYRLGDEDVRIDVRTEYDGGAWKVLDTLAERVLIRTNMPTLDHAKIGDIEVPVTTEPVADDESQEILLYPGVYTVSGTDVEHLSWQAEPLAVFDEDVYSHVQPLEVALTYQAEESLASAVTGQVVDFVRTCVAAAPGLGAPSEQCQQVVTAPEVRENDKLAVLEMPRVDGIDTRHATGDGWQFFSTAGKLRTTPADGAVSESAFQVQGFVSVSPDGGLKIAYRT